MMKLYKKSGTGFQEVARQTFADSHFERHLEELLEANPHLIGDLFIIGRQVRTIRNERIDLVALDRDGDIVIIELKRGPTHRRIVSQINSYLSVARKWRYDDLEGFIGGGHSAERELAKRFQQHFKCSALPDFNRRQRGIIVAEEVDQDTLEDLAGLRSPIMAIEFTHFSADGEEYLLMSEKPGSPAETSELAEAKSAPRLRKERLRDYDAFLMAVVNRVREILPGQLRGLRTTDGHLEREQFRRFHWASTDVHVGVDVQREADGDVLSVYFWNHKRAPDVAALLRSSEQQIRRRLSLTDSDADFDDLRAPIDQSLGKIAPASANQFVDSAADRAIEYLKTLKPILGDHL